MPTITIEKDKYLIRGAYSADDLHRMYDSYCEKYGHNLTLRQWAIQRGKVYVKMKKGNKE